MSAASWNRKLHRWGAVVIALPLAVILTTGILLQLKKDWSWVQPTTTLGSSTELALSWDQILEAARGIPEAGVSTWADVDRLDVRPERGMLKVRCKNRWELQFDTATGDLLSSEPRRSDLIESLHDGSWFHDLAKLGIFLPTGLVLCGLWSTGMYMWLLPHRVKRRRRQNKRSA